MSNKVKRSPLRIVISIVILLVAGYFGLDLTKSGNDSSTQTTQQTDQPRTSPTQTSSNQQSFGQSVAESQRALVGLAKAERSGEMVELQARVVKTLPDDNDGSRHQKFIIAIDYTPSTTDSVLVAHNIDLAPRVPLEEGSIIRIFGQYEWNDRGGVLHWTHHDPGGYHEEGWIELDGVRYD
ncbi:MAG: DUF3465 domain-containing protein [Phycisphaerales bacterium]